MDKDIIIDGVNVKDCGYYDKDSEPCSCEIWNNECEGLHCYYKQLKRLEQENDELKKQVKNQERTICELLTDCNNCDELNETKFRLKILDQTLEEIKEIAKGLYYARKEQVRIEQIIGEVLDGNRE